MHAGGLPVCNPPVPSHTHAEPASQRLQTPSLPTSSAPNDHRPRLPRSLRRPRATWLSSPLVNQLKAPVVCIGLTLLVWQLLCLGNADGFPGPIQVIRQTWDPYISKPFYDDGGTSKGIGLQILISLQRVAIGYTLAAVIGIAAGMAIGLNAFLRRGFDPLIQVLRTVPPWPGYRSRCCCCSRPIPPQSS